MINKLRFILIPFMMLAFQAHADESDWRGYIDAYVGEHVYYLYPQAVDISFRNASYIRALDIGSGTADIAFDMLSRGWDVTAVDKSARAKEIALERTKNLKNNGKFQFQQADMQDATLTGDYDLVVSFWTLPFGKKENVSVILKNISAHMKKGSLIALNFFGNDNTLAKNGRAFGLTEAEVRQFLADNQFKVIYYLNRIYDKPDNDNKPFHMDLIDVIAEKM